MTAILPKLFTQAKQKKDPAFPDTTQVANKRTATWEIFWLFLLTRVLLILVTYFGYIFLTQPKYSSTPVDLSTFIASWGQWDAKHYVNIAIFGYKTLIEIQHQKIPEELAFFPLFPLLISILGRPFGNENYLIVGMLISNLALLGTLFFLYQLAEEFGGAQTGRRTILYLCIFPTAFFFFTAYNESLFLFFTTGGFVALRRQHWWLAGLAGSLSALTRSTGIFFAIPFLYELWLHRQAIITHWKSALKAILALLLIPLGTALYSFHNWQITGNPLAFASVQLRWSRHLDWPWAGIWQNFYQIFWVQPFGSFNQVHCIIDLVITLAFIVLTIIGWRKLRPHYSLWLTTIFIYILISPSVAQDDALISNQRFVLEMFPAFMILAQLGIRYSRLHEVLLWVFPPLLGIFSLLFLLGKWMV
jgi:Gpi18-like mannosyltransferase